jgi:hypothetical protein
MGISAADTRTDNDSLPGKVTIVRFDEHGRLVLLRKAR